MYYFNTMIQLLFFPQANCSATITREAFFVKLGFFFFISSVDPFFLSDVNLLQLFSLVISRLNSDFSMEIQIKVNIAIYTHT